MLQYAYGGNFIYVVNIFKQDFIVQKKDQIHASKQFLHICNTFNQQINHFPTALSNMIVEYCIEILNLFVSLGSNTLRIENDILKIVLNIDDTKPYQFGDYIDRCLVYPGDGKNLIYVFYNGAVTKKNIGWDFVSSFINARNINTKCVSIDSDPFRYTALDISKDYEIYDILKEPLDENKINSEDYDFFVDNGFIDNFYSRCPTIVAVNKYNLDIIMSSLNLVVSHFTKGTQQQHVIDQIVSIIPIILTCGILLIGFAR